MKIHLLMILSEFARIIRKCIEHHHNLGKRYSSDAGQNFARPMVEYKFLFHPEQTYRSCQILVT